MAHIIKYSAWLALCCISVSAMADAPRHPIETIPIGSVELSEHPDHRSRTWTGVGRLRGDNTSFCTATLIDTRSESNPEGNSPAYIITNQRCLNTKGHGEYKYPGGIQTNHAFQGNIYFNNFHNTLGALKAHTLKKVTWQSNEGLNIAIVELNTSLSTLIAEGIHPLKIANRTPVTGDEILTLGIPEFKNLHATHCTQMPAVDIATYPWVSTNLLKAGC